MQVLESKFDSVYIASATGGKDPTIRIWRALGGEPVRSAITVPEVDLAASTQLVESERPKKSLLSRYTILSLTVLFVAIAVRVLNLNGAGDDD